MTELHWDTSFTSRLASTSDRVDDAHRGWYLKNTTDWLWPTTVFPAALLIRLSLNTLARCGALHDVKNMTKLNAMLTNP